MQTVVSKKKKTLNFIFQAHNFPFCAIINNISIVCAAKLEKIRSFDLGCSETFWHRLASNDADDDRCFEDESNWRIELSLVELETISHLFRHVYSPWNTQIFYAASCCWYAGMTFLSRVPSLNSNDAWHFYDLVYLFFSFFFSPIWKKNRSWQAFDEPSFTHNSRKNRAVTWLLGTGWRLTGSFSFRIFSRCNGDKINLFKNIQTIAASSFNESYKSLRRNKCIHASWSVKNLYMQKAKNIVWLRRVWITCYSHVFVFVIDIRFDWNWNWDMHLHNWEKESWTYWYYMMRL